MGSIGGVSAFGSQAFNSRLKKSTMPKSMTALEVAEKVRMGPVGKTEQKIHLEKANEMAKSGQPEESLHARLSKEAVENPEKGNLHLALIKKKNAQPYDPMEALAKGKQDAGPAQQATSLDGPNADDLALEGSKRNAEVRKSNSKASLENFERFGGANTSKSLFTSMKNASGYDPNGHALSSGSLPVGGVLNVMA
jgi:hypothetical protein